MMQPKFKYVSDCGVLIELGSEISDETSNAIYALDSQIAFANIKGVVEVVPALINLLVIFDPIIVNHHDIQKAISALFPISNVSGEQVSTHVIDVCYEDEFGPDLKAVADACGLSEDAVITKHLASELRVSMYGFAPGYAYMSGLSDAIQLPRKKTALRDVPAGSVIIAGQQCLITTMKMPTGWSIIGRTRKNVITGEKDRPFLFNVGDKVSFKRITKDEYLEGKNA